MIELEMEVTVSLRVVCSWLDAEGGESAAEGVRLPLNTQPTRAIIPFPFTIKLIFKNNKIPNYLKNILKSNNSHKPFKFSIIFL